ncbi:MAG: hypothetical protein ACK5RL_03915 [Acidimicrobiales bacterium]
MLAGARKIPLGDQPAEWVWGSERHTGTASTLGSFFEYEQLLVGAL